MDALNNLIKSLSRLPGLGSKSASRIAYHLISSDNSYNQKLAEEIASLQNKIRYCSVCGAFSENELCIFCSNPERDRSLLCVVENAQDVLTIASAGIYNGYFHVLGGAINPLNGVGPEDLRLRELKERLKDNCFKELIIATNPTEEGDTTALFIRHMLKGSDIVLTRLASGLPIGGDLEYADRLTLARSLRGRVTF